MIVNHQHVGANQKFSPVRCASRYSWPTLQWLFAARGRILHPCGASCLAHFPVWTLQFSDQSLWMSSSGQSRAYICIFVAYNNFDIFYICGNLSDRAHHQHPARRSCSVNSLWTLAEAKRLVRFTFSTHRIFQILRWNKYTHTHTNTSMQLLLPRVFSAMLAPKCA